jgi:hypothetical protein
VSPQKRVPVLTVSVCLLHGKLRVVQRVKAHYWVRERPLLVPLLCQLNPVHNFTPSLYLCLGHPSALLPFRPSDQDFLCICFRPRPFLSCPLNPLVYLISLLTDSRLRVQVMKLLLMQFCLSLHLVPVGSKHSPQLPVHKHSQSVFPPLMLETKFHTHAKTTGKIIV